MTSSAPTYSLDALLQAMRSAIASEARRGYICQIEALTQESDTYPESLRTTIWEQGQSFPCDTMREIETAIQHAEELSRQQSDRCVRLAITSRPHSLRKAKFANLAAVFEFRASQIRRSA